jgi:hypothetical protein
MAERGQPILRCRLAPRKGLDVAYVGVRPASRTQRFLFPYVGCGLQQAYTAIPVIRDSLHIAAKDEGSQFLDSGSGKLAA